MLLKWEGWNNITCFHANLIMGEWTEGLSWGRRAGALVQWLKLPAWKVGDCGFEPHSGLQLSKKQNCFFPAHCKDFNIAGTLWNPVSGGQCRLNILRIFSWPNLAYKLYAQRLPKTPIRGDVMLVVCLLMSEYIWAAGYLSGCLFGVKPATDTEF